MSDNNALTKKQLEALIALHYGELFFIAKTVGGGQHKTWYMRRGKRSVPLDVTSRVKKLCEKRMCRYMAVDKGLDRFSMPLMLTERGLAELAKHKEPELA